LAAPALEYALISFNLDPHPPEMYQKS